MVTCCGRADRAHSREARLRVEVSEWRSGTGGLRQTVIAALVVLVFHLVLRLWVAVVMDDDGV